MTDIDLSDLAADRGGSRPLRGYLASPAGTGPWPAVVMIHEIFGLDDVMRGHADRLAGLGYLTLAVDPLGCAWPSLGWEPSRWDLSSPSVTVRSGLSRLSCCQRS